MAKLFGIHDRNRNEPELKRIIKEMFFSFDFGKLDYYSTKGFGVGHLKIPTMNRKGIIEDKDFVVCFSGQIFDYEKDIELLKKKGYKFKTKNEEEFILNSYKSYGTDFLRKLNGTFVFVIYEKRTKKILLINDRYGLRPVYYYADNTKFVFASEIKAIIKDTTIKKEINWDFWRDFFSYGHAIGIKTPFNNIYSVPNGTIIEYHNGKIKKKNYWDYSEIKINYKKNEDEILNEGVEVLKRVFQRQTKGMKKCMIFLSGGYDSRCIAAAISKYTNVKIKAYTIPKTNVGKDTFKDPDAKYAGEVAKHLDIDHILVPASKNFYEKHFVEFVKTQDGIGYDNMWMMPLVDKIDENLMNFDGIAGDVFLKTGYMTPSFFHSKNLLNTKKIDSMNEKKLAKILHNKLYDSSIAKTENVQPFFVPEIKEKIKPKIDSILYEIVSYRGKENKIKLFQSKNRTKNVITLQPNNIIMRKTFSSLPFCDNEYVEFGLSVPMELKIRKTIYREILKKSFPDVMNVPSTNNDLGLKHKMRYFIIKYKLDFLRNFIGIMRSTYIKLRPIKRKLSDNPRDVNYLIRLAKEIDMPDFIDRNILIKNINAHVKNDRDPTYFLEPIMYFCVWYKEFMNNIK